MKLLLENWRKFARLHEAINPATIEKIQSSIEQAGGESYIIGGAVRDELLPDTPPSKDIDFLIRNLPLDQIANALAPLGKVNQVGKAFGVVTGIIDGEEFDFAIPRTGEEKTGEKHTDFDVTTDPNAPIEADLGRRDFTINALAKDSAGNIIDMFGGQEDLRNKIIRAVGDPNERFAEDPLRMMRALQFAVRFDFDIEPNTLKAIRNNIDKIDTLASERVFMEFNKAWTKGSVNSEKLVSLLETTGVGRRLFGNDFDPQIVRVEGGPEDKANGNFIAFFLNGGDFNSMRPTNDMIKHLDIAIAASRDAGEVYEYAVDQKEKMPLIANVLGQLGYHQQAEKIMGAIELPLKGSELEIGGRELMQMGFKGREIGQAQRDVLSAIHRGEIGNTYDEIVGFLQ